MTEEVWSEVKTATLRRYLAAIQAILDERAGKPIEGAVRGDLLIGFEASWPTGWCWLDDPPYSDGTDREDWPGAPKPLDPARLYDVTDWTLERDGVELPFWDLFEKWNRRTGVSP